MHFIAANYPKTVKYKYLLIPIHILQHPKKERNLFTFFILIPAAGCFIT